MKEVVLSGGYLAKVDDQDYCLVSQFKWYPLIKNGGRIYARANVSRVGGKKPTSIMMHRLIMGNPENKQIDHCNRDGLDNQRHNLRVCLQCENSRNKKKQDGSVSRFKGVSRNDCNRWRSRITVDGKTIELGTFSSESEAAMAYNAAAIRYFGEFARINVELS